MRRAGALRRTARTQRAAAHTKTVAGECKLFITATTQQNKNHAARAPSLLDLVCRHVFSPRVFTPPARLKEARLLT